MCSTSSLGCGGGAGDNGGYGTSESMYSRKCKRQKVPKRGPGVAELEKILREQEKRSDMKTKMISEGFSFTTSPFSSDTPNPLPKIVTSSADPNNHHISPPRTLVHVNNNGNSGGGNTCVNVCGSTAVLPENSFFPTLFNSCEPRIVVEVPKPGSALAVPFSTCSSNGLSTNDQPFPPSTLMRRSQNTSPSSAKTIFPHSEVPSSRIPPSAAGMSRGIEPPSSQTSFQSLYTCVWPEEEKMVGTKTPRQFSMEIPSPVLHFNFQIPTFAPQTSKTNPEPSEAISREVKVGGPDLKPNLRMCNFLPFGAPPTPPSNHVSQHDRFKTNYFPIQERMEEVDKRPFYSFLQLPQDQVETDFSLSNERADTRGDGIDLRLRL